MASPFYPGYNTLFGKWLIGIIVLFIFSSHTVMAQGSLTYKCAELGLSGTAALKCDPVSEDDPNDLAECYSYLVCSMPGSSQRFELRFPARKAIYHWTSSRTNNVSASLDSLGATLFLVKGYEISAYPRDFTIGISRYDDVKGGVIEGTFSGTMEAFIASKRSSVSFTVNGNFHTIRTGKFGDECRKARRPEAMVLKNARAVISVGLAGPLQQMGWQVKSDQGGTIMIANDAAPYRPLFICNGFLDLKLTLDPNTAYGKMINDSAEYYARQSTKEGMRNMFRMVKMQKIDISILENDPYLKSPFAHGAGDKYTVLHIAGAAFACRYYRAPQNDLDSPEVTTSLCFGNWDGADMNAKGYAGYPFIHKQLGPYLENMEIQIAGPAAAADDMIRKIDWKKLNAALSK